MVNKRDYVDLGLACADVCGALNRGVNGKQLDELSRSVCEAIEQLTMWVLPAVHIVCSISGLSMSPCSRKYISFQGQQDREGHSPLRDSPGNRIFRLA